MSLIAAVLKGLNPNEPGSAGPRIPDRDDLADVIAEALAGKFGDGWDVDVASSTGGGGQVTIFGRTSDGGRDFLVPLIVGQPVVLNAEADAVDEAHEVEPVAVHPVDAGDVPVCAVSHALVCCTKHGTHALPPNPHRGCLLR